MAPKRPAKNAQDAHLRIDPHSPTWKEVRVYCLAVYARACAVLADPGALMVDIRIAQGDRRTALGMLKLANPDAKVREPDLPELYVTGGADDYDG